MLEKFTPEEIAQIKRELKLLGNENSITKSIVLSLFREEIKEIFPETVSENDYGYYTSDQRKIMGALTILCDFALKNYDISVHNDIKHIEINRNIETKLQPIYKKMMYELLDVAKNIRKEEQINEFNRT